MAKSIRARSLSVSLAWLLLSTTFLSIPATGVAQSPNQVTVIGQDYAFEAPDTVKAGPTVFSLQNRGTVRHELVLVRLKEGGALKDYLKAATPEERRVLFAGIVGLIVAPPGEPAPGRLLADLQTGATYVLICNLQDTPEKPRHNQLGMAALLHVR